MPKTAKPRQVLTRDRVLAAALALVDQHGLEALTMRSLGESLSVEAMSLYRYCPSKADLHAGIADRVLGEIVFTPANRGWRPDLGNAMRAFWRVLVQHPNAVPLMLTTPLDTPRGRAAGEGMVRLVTRAGFAPPDAHRIFRMLQAFALGTALMLRANRPDSGMPSQNADDEPSERRAPSAERRAPSAERRVPRTAYPLLRAALAGPGSIDLEADFEVGLELQLDGIEAARTQLTTKRKRR